MKKFYLKNLSENDDKKRIIKDFIVQDTLFVEFIYNSDFIFTKDLRDFIWIALNIFKVPEKNISRIIIVADELNNNAIEHWSDKNWENKLRLKIEKNNNELFLNIEVEDNWKWKDAVKAIDMETMRAHKLKRWYWNHNSIRGRWLFLITVHIVDRLYFKNSKNGWLIVWVKKQFKL